ncbi:uncharacterized protein PITG_00153 [Phytophthora infestans T30-4]|uniref:Uncharacterized protein n=1 Tax=Phytophthora infestans (strain T30-4) TaxID=403677 RepID=D0MT10_PHYIT|nr:uncharacterized protein PITG_00153 [Phytophthora infestans T30-4]EEY57594.1 hypothetical protein PITG_00153 [Phytophthora infestans T30-4]|eukprot:XP_002908780.1 hypothetical protein PITG_00153 [Phytophthora infestans T30-4]
MSLNARPRCIRVTRAEAEAFLRRLEGKEGAERSRLHEEHRAYVDGTRDRDADFGDEVADEQLVSAPTSATRGRRPGMTVTLRKPLAPATYRRKGALVSGRDYNTEEGGEVKKTGKGARQGQSKRKARKNCVNNAQPAEDLPEYSNTSPSPPCATNTTQAHRGPMSTSEGASSAQQTSPLTPPRSSAATYAVT